MPVLRQRTKRPICAILGLIASAALLSACAGGKATGSQDDTASAERASSADPSPVQPAQSTPGAGQVESHSFHSKSLGVNKKYWLYLPSGYSDKSKRFPVIYMLHGLGGDESNWTRHMGLASAADAMGLQAIVVMPDGDDSFYVNSATAADYESCLQSVRPFGKAASMRSYCVKAAAYEDYIADDLVGHIDASYRTLARREARGIGGLSMGGYGALLLAMKHKDQFASVASHSGIAALLYVGPFPFAPGKAQLATDIAKLTKGLGSFGTLFSKIYGPELANWQTHDPAFLAKDLVDGELKIYLDCGTEDEFRLQNGASYLHEVLTKAKVSHVFELLPGHHDVHFWRDRIDDSLAFHAASLAKAASAPGN